MGAQYFEMQTFIQVFGKQSKSLRDVVVNDSRLEDFGLFITEQKRKGRSQGWAKIHGENMDGAVNIEWHAASQTLICRVVTKGGKSHDIAAAFVNFLLARISSKIASIVILPPSKGNRS